MDDVVEATQAKNDAIALGESIDEALDERVAPSIDAVDDAMASFEDPIEDAIAAPLVAPFARGCACRDAASCCDSTLLRELPAGTDRGWGLVDGVCDLHHQVRTCA